MKQESFRKLISGQKTGLRASFLRCLLGCASIFYLLVIDLRNFLYNKGCLKSHRVNAPVISIGNITTGGTGKTPLVIRLANLLHQMQFSPVILTRGYKAHNHKRATSDEPRATITDEPAILARSCPQAKVIVNPDRLAAASKVLLDNQSPIENRQSKIIFVLDDGFQHRRLARDLDIVTIDATCPFGYGKILPAGLLREPADAIKRADAIVLTRCDLISRNELARIEEKIRTTVNTEILIAMSKHSPICAKTSENNEISLDELKNKKIFAFCGIGNPDSFFKTVKIIGPNLVGTQTYDDHYKYTNTDTIEIYNKARLLNADLILTTQKDLTKCRFQQQPSQIQLAFLLIELKFIAGEDELKNLIKKSITGKISRKQKVSE